MEQFSEKGFTKTSWGQMPGRRGFLVRPYPERPGAATPFLDPRNSESRFV